MRGLDETDREILGLLMDDGRRSYSDIAEQVSLSPPAVSDRVERLRELGVIRRFTVELDRNLLQEGTTALLTVSAKPGEGSNVRDSLAASEAVEHLFVTADERLVCTVVATDIRGTVADVLPAEAVRSYDVRLLDESVWTPHMGQAELVPECVECGNRVRADGERERLDGNTYHFCCSSCRDSFLERYDRLDRGRTDE